MGACSGGDVKGAAGSGGEAAVGAGAATGGVSGVAGGSNAGAGGSAATAGTSMSGAGAVGGDGSGTGGASGASGSGGAAGTAANGTPTSVVVTTHDLSVDAKGSVFNVADDYFNDHLVPPTPVANFGCQSQVTTVVNADGSLDVGWLDYTNGGDSPWALKTPAMINITHIDAALATATTTATGISSYKLLGFTKDASGAFYVGYNKDHSFKNAIKDDPNNLNGNELHVAKLNGATVSWDKLIFGDQDNSKDATLGDPGAAANSVLGYDTTNDKIVLYLGHSMMWLSKTAPPTRHQAGFVRVIDPASGNIIPPSGDDISHFGAGWWYSHNFNQRLIIDGGNYYMLAHGDAYPRQLGIAKWTLNSYTTKNSTEFDESYWKVGGNEGDNNTNAQTGQFTRLGDGRFLIIHTSSEGRTARDVRLIFADGTSGTADAAGALWLTTNTGTTQATMPKLEVLGDDVLVTYALWDSSQHHQLTWYTTLLDAKLKSVVAPAAVANVEFIDAAPLFRFVSGPNAGSVGWVSGNATHTLSVHVATTN